jgi:hypothetical protein
VEFWIGHCRRGGGVEIVQSGRLGLLVSWLV